MGCFSNLPNGALCAQVVSLQLTARRLMKALMDKRANADAFLWLSGASAFFGLRHADGSLVNDASPLVRCDNVFLKAVFGMPHLLHAFLSISKVVCVIANEEASLRRTSYMTSGMWLLCLVGFDRGFSCQGKC